METDPVCDMDVDEKTAAVMAVYQGRAYFFCAQGCKAAFLKAPGRYTLSIKESRREGDEADARAGGG